MTDREKILDAVYASMDELNHGLAADQGVKKDLGTSLQTANGVLDSLGVTLFLVDLERRLESWLGTRVSLVNGSVADEDGSPLRSVAALVEYIESARNND